MKDTVKLLVFLAIAMMWLSGISHGQGSTAQAETVTTTENLTFHNYSLIQKADNGSFFAYDGADTIEPRLANAFQTNVDSQIKGTVTEYGIQFTYWSGMVIWGYSLNDNVHVQGNVQITVYMSSSDTISGLLSGGGYGMGLSEVDQNGNEIKRFTVEGPQSMGANPFTSTPKVYTLSVQVDYTFAKGNIVAFFAGAGATKQGYKFTIYFDSPDKNSGASLPILTQTPPPSPSPSPTFSPSPSPSPASSSGPGPSSTFSPSPSPTSSFTPSPSSSSPSPGFTTMSPTSSSSPSAILSLEALEICSLALVAVGIPW